MKTHFLHSATHATCGIVASALHTMHSTTCRAERRGACVPVVANDTGRKLDAVKQVDLLDELETDAAVEDSHSLQLGEATQKTGKKLVPRKISQPGV